MTAAAEHATAGRAAPHARMPCLDGLRGIAAVMVVLSHAPEFGYARAVPPLCGAYGVLIFFGLSGFLMGDLYLAGRPTSDAIKGYVAARIARIAPIYYVVVITSFLVCTFLLPDFVYRFSPTQFLRLLTFNGSASVFWSISPEVQFYFVFIPLWLLSARLGNDALFALAVLALGAACILTVARWPGILVVSKFQIFASGMLAAVLRRHAAPRLNPAMLLALHLASVALLATILIPGGSDRLFSDPYASHEHDVTLAGFYGDPIRCLLAGFLAFSLSFQTRLGTAIFANPLMALLGRCSFSIYLLHVVVFFGLIQIDALASVSPTIGTAAGLALTILLSMATYALIEVPARARARDTLLGLMNVRRAAVPLQRHTA